MFKYGFTRFCDDPEITCCKAEKELELLHEENERLYAELAELHELAKAKADGRLKILPAKPGDIDAVPVVLGKWKLYGNDDDSGMSYWCTVCNFQLSEDLFYSGYKNGRWIENGVFKYCPNCGAKMEVES